MGITAVMSLAALLLAWVKNRLFPTHVSSEGITAYSIWGVRRFVCWEDIAAARPIRILNLPYLRLDSAADRKVTWVALYAADPIGFHNAVRSAMPPDSPIAPHFPVDA